MNSIDDICRVCLEKSEKLYPLVSSEANTEDVTRMIKYCTQIEIVIKDSLPKGVCVPCFRNIKVAYDFIRQFRETNKLLENQSYENEEQISEEELIEFNIDNEEEIIIEYSEEDSTLRDTSRILKEEIREEAEVTPVTAEQFNYPVENAMSNTIQKNDKESFICPICRISFTKFETGFVRHLHSTHSDVKLQCNKCNIRTTLTTDLYIQHFRKAHRFQCHICNKSYGRRSGLYYHLKTHNNKKLFECSYTDCTKSFLTAWCLRKHVHTHSETTKYICSKCGIEFKTYGSYKYHMRTHDGKRNYLCTVCGQTFLQPIHLKYHMWRHDGIKMFACDKCHKSYTSQTQLRKHRNKNCGVSHNVIIDK